MSEPIDAPVIDFGSHLHSERVTEAPAPSDQLDDVRDDPDRLLEWFEKGGVDRVVLSQGRFVGETDVETAASVNDDLLDVVDAHEEYYGLASIPVGAGGEAAATEFERCLDAGYNGGYTWTSVAGQDLTDAVFEPILEVADRTGAPILVHPTPSTLLLQDYPGEHVLEPVYQINHAIGREARMCGSILKVVNAGILDQYPNLNLVYHHHGGNIASMMGRIDLRLTRGQADGGGLKTFEAFKEQLEERVYIDTSGYFAYSSPLRTALEQFPASNILLATDVPAEPKTPADLAEYVTTVTDVAPRSEARKILGQNALDIMVNV